jgi:hypothetical protein
MIDAMLEQVFKFKQENKAVSILDAMMLERIRYGKAVYKVLIGKFPSSLSSQGATHLKENT